MWKVKETKRKESEEQNKNKKEEEVEVVVREMEVRARGEGGACTKNLYVLRLKNWKVRINKKTNKDRKKKNQDGCD